MPRLSLIHRSCDIPAGELDSTGGHISIGNTQRDGQHEREGRESQEREGRERQP
jgi:hypothetical protein